MWTKTWAATTRDSAAMDEIKGIIEVYLPPDSGISPKDVVSEIIRVIETRTAHRFVEVTAVEPEGTTGS